MQTIDQGKEATRFSNLCQRLIVQMHLVAVDKSLEQVAKTIVTAEHQLKFCQMTKSGAKLPNQGESSGSRIYFLIFVTKICPCVFNNSEKNKPILKIHKMDN